MSKPSVFTEPIDLVYTWVNGNDPNYQRFRNQYAPSHRQNNPERFRDDFESLKYSFRSVEKFMPWVRHIYLVTQRPQKPDWLNIDHPKITLVHHDQIFEHERHQPNFNSNPIESHLHRVPGISDHFIYMNDDHLLANTIERTDFFTEDGRIRIFGTLLGENFAYRRYEVKNEFIGIGFTDHIPMLLKKERWAEMLTVWPELTEKTRMNKFREDSDMCMHRVYRYLMLKKYRRESRPVYFWEVLKMLDFHKVKNEPEKQRKAFERIEKKRPKFYCLNDDLGEAPNPEVIQIVKDFFERMYPEKAAWEI